MRLESRPHTSDAGRREGETAVARTALRSRPTSLGTLRRRPRGCTIRVPAHALRLVATRGGESVCRASTQQARPSKGGAHEDKRRSDGPQEQVRGRHGSAAAAIARRGGALPSDRVEQAVHRDASWAFGPKASSANADRPLSAAFPRGGCPAPTSHTERVSSCRPQPRRAPLPPR